jgi:hypothetical protein
MFTAIGFDAKYKGVGVVEIAQPVRSDAESVLKREFPDVVFDQIVIVTNGNPSPDLVDTWNP